MFSSSIKSSRSILETSSLESNVRRLSASFRLISSVSSLMIAMMLALSDRIRRYSLISAKSLAC